MDEGDFPAVPKTDRRSRTNGCDFLIPPRGVLRSGSWRRWCFDLDLSFSCIWDECVVNL